MLIIILEDQMIALAHLMVNWAKLNFFVMILDSEIAIMSGFNGSIILTMVLDSNHRLDLLRS